MNITYVLPPNTNVPIGGYKIVYQYANELVKRGNNVNLVFLKNGMPTGQKFSKQNFKNKIRSLINAFKNSPISVDWYKIDSRINLYFNIEKAEDFPDADVIIATAAPTTYIKNLSKKKGRKFYFIQNYETWWYADKESELLKTFAIKDMTNIVISHELESKVNSATTARAKYLPNFYDPNEFYLQKPISPRKNVVALLNHRQATKRTQLGIEILIEVRKQIPDLQVELFGVPDEPDGLPNYFHVTRLANANELRERIYGRAKVYLLPSILEGWCLTGMEAMASGAALVASEIGGLVDYANSKNSVLIKPDKKEAFIDAIVNLLKDDEKQQRIAKQGYNDVQQYRIQNSVQILESILKGK